MSVILTPPQSARGKSSKPAGAEQRFVLDNVTWQQYEEIGKALENRAGLRITYDQGTLELMTTSRIHEIYKTRLGRILETLCEEFNLPMEPAGNMTFKRQDLARGLEPDQCYWISHESQVRGQLEWNPASDPPPDLVIEIEISRGAQDRMSIYAALGVPEVWRFDGESLVACLLQSGGSYKQADRSPTFPAVPLMELIRFFTPSAEVDYLSGIREFRSWVRELVGK
jgi:Uma2 family endonuclease